MPHNCKRLLQQHWNIFHRLIKMNPSRQVVTKLSNNHLEHQRTKNDDLPRRSTKMILNCKMFMNPSRQVVTKLNNNHLEHQRTKNDDLSRRSAKNDSKLQNVHESELSGSHEIKQQLSQTPINNSPPRHSTSDSKMHSIIHRVTYNVT